MVPREADTGDSSKNLKSEKNDKIVSFNKNGKKKRGSEDSLKHRQSKGGLVVAREQDDVQNLDCFKKSKPENISSCSKGEEPNQKSRFHLNRLVT